jgi:hypothetical protein
VPCKRAQKDAMLHHPADGIQWRNFDQKHKDFAVEVRNIIFRLSIDGMNPFGETLFFKIFQMGLNWKRSKDGLLMLESFYIKIVRAWN